MYIRSLIVFTIIMSSIVGLLSIRAANEGEVIPMYAWVGCDGNAVTRTEAGKIVMTKITKNLPNCNGPKVSSDVIEAEVSTTGVVQSAEVTTLASTSGSVIKPKRPKVTNTILLDLSQKDIVNYRVEKIKEEQIRYANAIRSVRIRSGKSIESNTNGYLIKNDAVKVTGKVTGWTPVRSGEVVVTDARENTVSIDTSTGTSGYTATKWLRNATASDLVKIGQADIAYWTDIIHTNVDHLVNVRNNPWYTAPIVTTLGSDVVLYRVATVDNWSQVQSVDGSIRGFIRSDFISVDTAQLVEVKPLLK